MKPILEDSRFPDGLREDLLRARAAGHDYPTAAKLLQLKAALTERPAPTPEPRHALREALKQLSGGVIHPGWKLAALIALAGGAVWLAQPSGRAPDMTAKQGRAVSSETPAKPQLPEPPAPAPAPAIEAASVRSEPQQEAADSASPSRREIAQLVRIRALVERDPAAAVRLAERSEREFAHGLLREERQALAIVALANSGARDAAARKARHYFARYPHSPMRELIEGALRR